MNRQTNVDPADVERALRESEERYRAFIAISAEGIWRFELDQPVPVDAPVDEQVDALYMLGHLAECNDAMARMYGFERPEEILGARLGELLVRTDPANVEYLRAFIRSGYRLTDAESAEEDRDGRAKFFLNNLIGIVADGHLIRAWGTQRDITERKLFEAERDELLARERLAREEAQRASRLKDEFLATVSHELRTPLTAVLGWSRLLRLGGFDAARQAAAIETIERNARAQAQLIEDLLDVSRIVTGKLSIDVARVDVSAFVLGAVDGVRPTALAKRIRIATTVEDDSPLVVLGDAGRLEQVVWNLLTNAVKFTPPGGEVHVRVASAGDDVEIAVRDTGEGIAPDFLPHVFERFRQADATISRMHGGLGLGLAIVSHVVELHGGRIHAESDGIGKGATFVVRIPKSGLQLAAGARDEAAAQRLDGIRVLLVDDDVDAREMMTFVLERAGALVVGAGSTAEAILTIVSIRPDVVVSDLGMPGEDGLELVRRIRAFAPEHGGALPAVAVTAYASPDDRVRALEAGFQSHLAKPVDPERLVAVVADLVGRGLS